jgi:adenylyltransferase/sulfurtransferase
MSSPLLSEPQRQRYSRQIRLAQLGEIGQRRLLDARALIVGVGGLGSPAAIYLTAAGVGRLVLSDYDRVEVSNLQRQVVHRTGDIGEVKARSARANLLALNPAADITAIDWELDGEALDEQVRLADVVLDCSDNFPTRFTLNRACVRHGRPLVSAAVIRLEGQITTFLPGRPDSPCYRCLYRHEGREAAEACSAEGVLAPVAGLLGTLQALEAVKLLAGVGSSLCGRLLLVDAATMDLRMVRLRRDPACPECGARAPAG